MPRAKLQISIPTETWIHGVSTEYPDAVFRVNAVLTGGDMAFALLELHTASPVPILADIERHDEIDDFDLLWKHDETAMLQIETSNPLLLFPILNSGIPVQTPFDVEDGTARWEIATSAERLSELGSRLDAAGIRFDLEYVVEEPPNPADALLTDRQREVLLAAAERGYYDTPRGATLTDVSESLGISKATGSDVLHRAEGKVLKWFIDGHVTGSETAGG